MINTNDLRVKQKSYSQNAEDAFVLDYFKGFKGTLFDIGANDGTLYSNSRLLIENDWQAHLFEPGRIYDVLVDLHNGNDNVRLNNFGLSDQQERLTFWESENHVPNGNDYGLVSTTVFEETKRWPNVKFHQQTINLTSFNDYWEWIGKPTIDFISLDVEGMEMKILKAINLTDVGCSCLCIEFNGIPELKAQFTDYCVLYGLKLAHSNNENLLFTKNK